MQRDTIRRAARILFWATAIFAYVMAVIPAQDAVTGSDKTDHLLAFGTLAGLARLGWSRSRATIIALLLVLFGIGIELSQATAYVARDADVRDVIADAIGILCGLTLGWALLLLIRRPKPASQI